MYFLRDESHPNLPNSSCAYGQMLVIRGTGDTIAQVIFQYGSNHDVYYRAGNPSNVGGTGTWSSWAKINDGGAATLGGKSITDIALKALTPTYSGTLQGSGKDFNSYITTGIFHWASDSDVTSCSNKPCNYSGCLTVNNNGSTGTSLVIYQTYQTYNSNTKLYIRSCWNTTWSPWVDLTQTVIPIAGTDLGGVKNGGNVTIAPDGTMNVALKESDHRITVTLNNNSTTDTQRFINALSELPEGGVLELLGTGLIYPSSVITINKAVTILAHGANIKFKPTTDNKMFEMSAPVSIYGGKYTFEGGLYSKIFNTTSELKMIDVDFYANNGGMTLIETTMGVSIK